MDRKENIYRKSLYEQDLQGLAELCANVANNPSAGQTHVDTAHALRVEWVRWVRLSINGLPGDGKKEDRSLNDDKTKAGKSLKERMQEFLTGVPSWMLSGI